MKWSVTGRIYLVVSDKREHEATSTMEMDVTSRRVGVKTNSIKRRITIRY
ncbi:hypothetical protein VCR17J2_440051 [Vibrio coralliirubri]|nr:hypothetical protein VCR17J2_440051 [Vibrio coralliirubri]